MNLNNYQFYKIEEKFSDIDDNDDNDDIDNSFIKINNKWISEQTWPVDLQKFEFKLYLVKLTYFV